MKQFIEEFKAFALKGNVVDLAIGVIIGGAFGNIVTSIVNDVIMPLFGIILGGISFEELSIVVGKSTIKYGMFIQNVVNFLIISFTIFCAIKLANMISRKKKQQEAKEEAQEAKVKSDEVLLLEEIRDSLRAMAQQETAGAKSDKPQE